jgi:adenine-specific DNA-methyltransferase
MYRQAKLKTKIMSNEQKITNDIKVPNKDLEALRLHFPHCFDKNGKFDIAKFQNQLNTQNLALTTERESYGLDWLGKSYARLLASNPATTLLKEDITHNSTLKTKNSQNLLIKGDNLEVLKHLSNAYHEKVKMIYIDPPYNTGSEGFVYKDDRKFTVKELQNLIGVDAEKAKRILSFTQSHSNSHSAWLTFMYPRLYIAKQLLKDDGVIFISIDDNEVAQLRLLMDEIFGEENFVACIVRQEKAGAGHDSKGLAIEYDYIVCYRKSPLAYFNRKLVDVENDEKYNLYDEFIQERGRFYLRDLDFKGSYSQSLDYPILLPSGKEVWAGGKQGQPNTWRWSKKKFEWGIENHFIVFKEDKVYIKQYQFVDNEGNKRDRYLPYRALTKFLNSEGTQDLSRLGLNATFSFPKSVSMIKYLLEIGTNRSNDIILDFFVGSGTTGDAVMQLNAEDGGNRKFILVQLPEPIDPKKNKMAFDFVKDELKAEPTIFEITKERLLKAAKKINVSLDEKTAKLKSELPTLENKEAIEKLVLCKAQNTFKVFETTPIWENYDFEAEQFDSSQKLFDVGRLSEDDIKALLTTWKTYDGIPLTAELLVVSLECLVEDETQNSTLKTQNYEAYYGNNKLYLMNKGFNTNHLKALLEKIDTDKHFEPKSLIAFGHHLESKSLREISENVKNYNNKKKSDIDFITRY